MSPKHTEQDQIDVKWLGKKLVFWHKSQRVGRSLIIVKKCIKETEIWFFQCKIEFYFTHEHQNLYFHLWLPPRVKILPWCSFSEIKFDLTLKNSITLCFSFRIIGASLGVSKFFRILRYQPVASMPSTTTKGCWQVISRSSGCLLWGTCLSVISNNSTTSGRSKHWNSHSKFRFDRNQYICLNLYYNYM